jgi:hypothetical protein
MHKAQLHFNLNVFLTGIHRLLFTNKGQSAFFSASHFQGQLQTPQSLCVPGERTIWFVSRRTVLNLTDQDSDLLRQTTNRQGAKPHKTIFAAQYTRHVLYYD